MQFSSDRAWESLAASGAWAMASQVAVAERCPRRQPCAFRAGPIQELHLSWRRHSAQTPCSVADANPFLQSVHRCMTSRLLQLPDKHSVTALLNTWAESIHQACLSAA